MAAWLPTVLLLTTGLPPVDFKFVQVAPARPLAQNGIVARSPGQSRAVILIEGLELNLLDHRKGPQGELRFWQQPGSVIVKALSADADVFSFCYGQTAPVTDMGELPALRDNVQHLRQLGYTEVVFVGYSAGGIVARQFVEDNPGIGVTRVIQVCTPNLGSTLARIKSMVGPAQESFLQSLTKEARSRAFQERRGKRIPENVEFVCVLGNGLVYGDGITSTRSQWPDDLQVQGVPVVIAKTEHWEVMRSERSAIMIARLVRENQPRWDAAKVAAMRKHLWPTKVGFD
jgi:pimeloyl-ACP methyl ester carboxylesterase